MTSVMPNGGVAVTTIGPLTTIVRSIDSTSTCGSPSS
jgi:hypothetical protein